ncbi:carboxymuconolactone decarboxylase family protein [Paraburkholderia agricolaris]|uniref:carboxymuconolactone decarboxylase family protein n=1 Tax=Paraburkholderia agricolaris TaxID=2152888 RepID=UPI001290A0AF|nr:carboxymuconolactone decarboxylase family protein [Paraburkholderia agricolaris]
MKRIADLDPDHMTPAQRSVYDTIASGPRKGVRGPLAVWLHRPELAQNAQALGRYCRYETSLEPRLSELAILVIARIWGSEYEWYAHKPIALEAGVSADVVEAIRTGAVPAFAHADEATIHTFLLELHRERKVSDATYGEAVEQLGETGVVDLVGLAGYYTLISMTISVFQVSPPAGAANELGA